MVRAVSLLLLVVIAVELAVAESFMVAARPFGTDLPLAAAVAAVGNVLLARVGGRLLPLAFGAVVPGVAWLLVVLPLGVARPEGDVIVTGTSRGIALLVVGSVAVVVGASLPRATPGDQTRR